MLLSAGIPLMIGASISFFQRLTRTGWLFIAAIGIAAFGASTSAIILIIPIIFAVAVVACSARAPLHSIITYGSTAVSLVLYALCLLLSPSASPTSDSIPNQGWPTTFVEHALLLWNPNYPITPIVAALACTGCLVLCEPKQRMWLIVYTGAIGLTILNPLLDSYVIHYGTQPNI